MKLLVFVKKDCPMCPQAKQIAEKVAKKLNLQIEILNVEKDITTALMYNVFTTPSIVFEHKGISEVLSRGEPLNEEELENKIKELMENIT